MLRILVAIASYGTNNDSCLKQLIAEYRSMPYEVDIVVVSNIPKQPAAGVEVVVGLPDKDPWSLPFAHKPIFGERAEKYDLFIYSEDDTLLTKRHIEAFLDAAKVLRPDEIPGFLRSEQAEDGTVYYSTVHSHYHWDVNSVCRRGNETFAYFTNEHGACYILTKEQLRKAIASGGFLVPPHKGKYDLLVSAATDPYTQCGFKKLVSISRLEDFTCKHLTNKYIGKTGLKKPLVDLQIAALLELADNSQQVPQPIRTETYLPTDRWCKSYYEPNRDAFLGLIPSSAKTVLSLGCGSGNPEEALLRRGVQVSAVPLDVVIGRLAEARGVRVIRESLEGSPLELAGETFDALLVLNLLHLTDDPVRVLSEYRKLLAKDGSVVVSCPSLNHLGITIRQFKGDQTLRALRDSKNPGIQQTSHAIVRGWLQSAGFQVTAVEDVFSQRWGKVNQWSLGLLKRFCAEEFAVAGRNS
jgi:SAM-dependent methyltransferase